MGGLQKAATLAQVGQFYFAGVGQFYIAANKAPEEQSSGYYPHHLICNL